MKAAEMDKWVEDAVRPSADALAGANHSGSAVVGMQTASIRPRNRPIASNSPASAVPAPLPSVSHIGAGDASQSKH